MLLQSLLDDSGDVYDEGILKTFILSNLIGEAQDAVYFNKSTVDDVKTALLSTIKAEPIRFIDAKINLLICNCHNDVELIEEGTFLANSLYSSNYVRYIRSFLRDEIDTRFQMRPLPSKQHNLVNEIDDQPSTVLDCNISLLTSTDML